MRDTKETGSAVCELLLVVFFLGALLCTLRRAGIFGLPFTPPGGAASWIAGILAVDAVMAGSLLAWYVLPVTTLLFGAAASAAGNALLDMPDLWWRQLLLLGLTVPIHFVLSGWSLTAAGEMRKALTAHGRGRSTCAAALLLLLGTACAASLVYFLLQHGLI
ncbi:MAG: hypothetical protein IJT29_06110 [Oscillospiraceae bacterium]|nr:hypothetical protein [Oscillospiraceae bacterium]